MSDTKDTKQDAPAVDTPATAPKDAPATPQAGADLSVQDLQGLKTIIDVASSRGAFKPNEMMSVGVHRPVLGRESGEDRDGDVGALRVTSPEFLPPPWCPAPLRCGP